MSTFTQWAKTRRTAHLNWVCGDQPALVSAVLGEFRRKYPGQTWALWADDEEPRDVWDELLSAPPLLGRLLIVHRAEKLGASLSQMSLLDAGSKYIGCVVFVSDERDFARSEEDGKKVLAPHLSFIQESRHGQLVRCCAPSKYEAQLALTASWWPGAGTNHARTVLRLCGGDLTLAAGACDKARRAGLAPTDKHAALVCEDGDGTGFADPLVAGDKAAAMAAAQRAGPGETGAGIGLLASRLTMLAAISDALRGGATPSELPYKTRDIDRWLLGRLAPHAVPYDAARVRRCRELLAMAEHSWRSGATGGVAESLIANWLSVVTEYVPHLLPGLAAVLRVDDDRDGWPGCVPAGI
jgi:hypothetical protein